MIEEALSFLDDIHELSPGCKNYLRAAIRRRDTDKDGILLKIGDVNEKLYFIVIGALHCFYYIKEKPVSAWFFFEKEMVVSIGSFYRQVPSEECIVAMEPSILLYITKADYDYLNNTFLEFNYVARVLLERYLEIFSEHPRFIRKHPVAERVQLVLQRSPEILDRVPSNALASWLAMEPETLSRIRGAMK